MDHDVDIEADQWCYNGRDVYRGSFDPQYTHHNLNVYWLYNDELEKVGLVEHEVDSPEIFKVLWFKQNPFATFYQDDAWVSTGKTLWSLLSNEAYQDCLEDDFKTVSDRVLQSGKCIVTPSMLLTPPKLYTCSTCNKKSFEQFSCSNSCVDLDFSQFSLLFVDDEFRLYHTVKLQQLDASVQEQEEPTVESPLKSPEFEDELSRPL
jgi:hypothetical protein